MGPRITGLATRLEPVPSNHGVVGAGQSAMNDTRLHAEGAEPERERQPVVAVA